MPWLSKNYDRAILLLASIAALVFCVMILLNSGGFKGRFVQERPAPKNEIADPGTAGVEEVGKALGENNEWGANQLDEKRIHLNVSVPLVQKGNEVYDMYLNDKLLRDPVPNTWLLDNRILFLRADCLQLDPDRDGFSNIDEWKGTTDPQDDGSHPPYTDKLVMVERVAIPYTIVFKGAIEPQFQIQRTEPQKKSWFVAKGDTFEEDRFTVVDYTKKMVDDPKFQGSQKDVSELLVRDNFWEEDIVLVKREDMELPTLFAIFEYRLKGKEQFQVKKGDIFSLPNDETSRYKLTDVSEDGAEITNVEAGDGAEAIRIPMVQ